MKLEREEILFGFFWMIIIVVVAAHVLIQPDQQPVAKSQAVVRSDSPYSDDQSPLGPLDIPGAASWSGDEPDKNGRQQ